MLGTVWFNVPTNTILIIPGDGFYRSNDPTNTFKALKKEDMVVGIEPRSHQAHLSIVNNTAYKNTQANTNLSTVKWGDWDVGTN